MKFSLFRVALKNLRRKPFRTGILVFSVALLVGLLVFGASFMIRVDSSIKRAADRFGADILVVPSGAREQAEEALLETSVKTFYMDRSLLDRVRSIEGVERAAPQTYLTSVFGICCDVPAMKIVAFDPENDFIVKPWMTRVLGRDLKLGEAIVGYVANENMILMDVESSVLFNVKFDFVGVLEQTDTGLDNGLFITEANMADILKHSELDITENEISVIFVKVKPGYDPFDVIVRMENEIIEVDTIERSSIGTHILAALADINLVFMVTIALSALLAASLAWSVFSAIANERLREVGIMRAIGARCSHVFWLFIYEVLVLAALGSVAGIAFGTALSEGMAGSFTLISQMATSLSIAQRLEVSAFGLVAGLLICMVGSLSSIMRIRRMDALRALKEI